LCEPHLKIDVLSGNKLEKKPQPTMIGVEKKKTWMAKNPIKIKNRDGSVSLIAPRFISRQKKIFETTAVRLVVCTLSNI
jgi:hypothetical protein